MRSKAVQICRFHLCSPDRQKLFLKTWLGYFYMLENVTVLFTDSLSHFTAHPPLLFYFSIPLGLLWNHGFNKRRLRRKRITPSLWLYKTCLFHICCYNYTAICFYSQLFSFFLSLPSIFICLCVNHPTCFFLFFLHFFPFISILAIHGALKLI